MTSDPDMTPAPLLVAAEMGYGHLRAAWSLADALGVPVNHADRAPLADAEEQRVWERVRRFQDFMSRPSWVDPLLGGQGGLMDRVTAIAPLDAPHLDRPQVGVRMLQQLVRRGLGRGLVEHLRRTGAPLLTTFYAPAIIADAPSQRCFCVVTDADIHRVWVPASGHTSRIHYLVPSHRAMRRLMAYGVPGSHVTLTGFPLPLELVGGADEVARRNLAARLVRLDPSGAFRSVFGRDVERELGALPAEEQGAPPRAVFAVGGAGGQLDLVARFLPGLRASILDDRLRVTLVAGTRRDVAAALEAIVDAADVRGRVPVLFASTFEDYYRRFNGTLAGSDLLWTKPSEMSFYAALGVALVLSSPLGAHERYNSEWLTSQGAALASGDPGRAATWLAEWLDDGVLAAAAWNGFLRLPRHGSARIAAAVQSSRPRAA